LLCGGAPFLGPPASLPAPVCRQGCRRPKGVPYPRRRGRPPAPGTLKGPSPSGGPNNLQQPLPPMAGPPPPHAQRSTGGTLARSAAEGCTTVLVTCTGGEEGEIVDPEMDIETVKPRLAEVRLAELRASVAVLGIHHLELLGYRDSGMAGTPANDDP